MSGLESEREALRRLNYTLSETLYKDKGVQKRKLYIVEQLYMY